MADITGVTYNTTISAPTEPTKDGYTFAGWYKEDTLANEWNFATDTVTVNPTTLYANWTVDTYDVIYMNHSGGTITGSLPAAYDGAKTYTYGVGLTIPTTTPYTRTGYTFAGWYTQQTGGVKVTKIDETSTGDVTLYAQWTVDTYDVIYMNHSNGDITDNLPAAYDSAKTYTYGVGLVIPTITPYTRTGYTFAGWYDAATGGTRVTEIGATEIGTKTLYARWMPNTYAIAYENLNGATNSNPASYTYGVGVASFADPGDRAGYTFAGWYSAATGGTRITGISATEMGDRTLYARWTAISYPIAYENLNGATNNGNPTSYIYGVGVASFASPGSRVGCTFDGWYSALSGGNAVTSISATDIGPKTLYARWTAISYTIAYRNLNGATNSNPSSYTYGVGVASFADPGSRAGYTFSGWYSASTGGSRVTSISATTTGDQTLYARWTATGTGGSPTPTPTAPSPTPTPAPTETATPGSTPIPGIDVDDPNIVTPATPTLPPVTLGDAEYKIGDYGVPLGGIGSRNVGDCPN